MRLAWLSALPCLLLAGCSLTPTAPFQPETSRGSAIQGKAFGGQQPIVGAHVYLLAVNTTGNGGVGIAPSTSNASVSLLTPGNTGNAADSIGSFVTTDAGGFFSIGGDYTCTQGQQLYLYVLGGNPGAGTNAAASEMAVLGNCPSSGDLSTQVPYVWVNEVSTVVAAYALAGFASDATHISSSSTALARTGVANAAATALNMINLAAGAANTTTSATGSNGSVPQAKINTIANILASCINSTGPASYNCSTLFSNATNAASSGTAPSETASAAINIAHFPGSNVATLYGLVAGAGAAFSPSLSTTPNDFLLVIKHSNASFVYPSNVTVDAAGNVLVSESKYNASSLTQISPTGSVSTLIGSGLNSVEGTQFDLQGNLWLIDNASLKKFSGGTLSSTSFTTLDAAQFLAVDTASTVWIANTDDVSYGGGLTRYAGSTGSMITTNSNYPQNVAIDTAGNAWVAEAGSGTDGYLSKFTAAGSPVSSYGSGTLKEPSDLAFDHSGNLWIADFQGGFFKYSSTGALIGTYAPPSSSVSTGSAQTLAVDGAGNIWAPAGQNGRTILTELNSAGTALSPATAGYTDPCFQHSYKVAIDGSGNVWFENFALAGWVCEVIGSATPVVTPLVNNLTAPYNAAASRP